MSTGVKVLPLELSDAEVKALIVSTLSRAQDIFPTMNLEELTIGARRPVGSEDFLWAWRIATNFGAFDISNNLRLVRIQPEPDSKMKKKGKLSDVVKALFSLWCPDWQPNQFAFDKEKDAGGWLHARQIQQPDEFCIYENVCRFRFYDGGELETFSRTDIFFSKKNEPAIKLEAAIAAINKVASANKLEFFEAPLLKARMHEGQMRACYVSRGTNSSGYSAVVVLDADTGRILRADN